MKNQHLENSKVESALRFASPNIVMLLTLCVLTGLILTTPNSFAQSETDVSVQLEQVRWKSESQIRAMLGDPTSVRGPIGTHASYQLWNYEGYSIAFANNRAFHLFDKNSLTKFELEEKR